MTTLPKNDPHLILFTKTLIRFFLSLKHPHALTFFFYILWIILSLVDKKILEKKNSQSFFIRHFRKWCEIASQKVKFPTFFASGKASGQEFFIILSKYYQISYKFKHKQKLKTLLIWNAFWFILLSYCNNIKKISIILPLWKLFSILFTLLLLFHLLPEFDSVRKKPRKTYSYIAANRRRLVWLKAGPTD